MTDTNGNTKAPREDKPTPQELEQARRDNVLFALSDLEDIELKSWEPGALRLAYTQAHATVRYMHVRFGQRPLAAMMTALAEGTPPEEALKATYGRTYAMLEKEVASRIGRLGR